MSRFRLVRSTPVEDTFSLLESLSLEGILGWGCSNMTHRCLAHSWAKRDLVLTFLAGKMPTATLLVIIPTQLLGICVCAYVCVCARARVPATKYNDLWRGCSAGVTQSSVGGCQVTWLHHTLLPDPESLRREQVLTCSFASENPWKPMDGLMVQKGRLWMRT